MTSPQASPPAAGEKYIYAPKHGNGFGHNAKGDVLSAEMQELDLTPDTAVTVLEVSVDNEVLADWIDAKGLPRITAIPMAEFQSDFKKSA